MSAADIAQTIQLIIAPVVLITACTLMQNGILGRYTAIGQLIRALSHERLDILRSNKRTDLYEAERLEEIDRQLPLLIQRHRLLQNASLTLYTALSILFVSMFAIALSVALSSGIAATLALLLFLGGTGVLFWGVLLISQEIRRSHQAICYEVGRILSL